MKARPLRGDLYGPYGTVVDVPEAGGRLVNLGTAHRHDHMVRVVSHREAATLNVAMFRCEPAPAFPATVRVLERHAASTQVFLPMGLPASGRYLVVVARGEGPRGDGPPDLTTLAAFVARGDQGIAYHPGIWHHPMIALDVPTTFACLVHEDGTAADCEVVTLATPISIAAP